jgi:hypothetical protein
MGILEAGSDRPTGKKTVNGLLVTGLLRAGSEKLTVPEIVKHSGGWQ